MLHGGGMRLSDVPVEKARANGIGCRHRVLDRKVDADPTDRRHRMRCVTDAEHSTLEPFLEPVDDNGQQLDLVPVV